MDRLAVVVVGLSAALAVPAGVEAQVAPRVALAPIEGANVVEPTATLTRVLGAHTDAVELSPADDYVLAAHREGVDHGASDHDLARVGRTLHVDFVVAAAWSQSGRRGNTLRVHVVRVRDGEALATVSWEVSRAADLPGLEPDLWAQLEPHLRASVASATTSSEPVPASADGVPAADSSGVVHVPSPTPGLGWLALGVEMGAGMRYWRVPLLGDTAPRGYENPGYLEFAADAVGLLRFADDRWGAGVSAGVTLPLAIGSAAPDASGAVVSLPTSSLEVRGGAALAYRPASGGSVVARTEFFTHAFAVDTAALAPAQQLASISYTGLRVAMEGVLPFYATHVAEFGVLFGAEIRIASVGSDARAAFGTMAGTSLGLGGRVGLALRLDGVLPGLAVRGTAELLRYRTSFAGTATLGTASDSEDDYVCLHLGLTYAFGSR